MRQKATAMIDNGTTELMQSSHVKNTCVSHKPPPLCICVRVRAHGSHVLV